MTMFLVFTVGFANLRGFQRRKILDGAATRLRSHLRLAQEMALSGRKPPAVVCLTRKLESVRLRRLNQFMYRIEGGCSNGASTTYQSMEPSYDYDLRIDYPGITMAAFAPVTFRTLGRGVDTPITVTLTSTAGTRSINITTGGQIN
jgi:hypothetical protein